MPVDEARQYLHTQCKMCSQAGCRGSTQTDVAQHRRDVADTAIARGVHGDTSRIIRSRGFTLLPKHRYVRNFADVLTGAKIILCFKKTRYGVSLVLSPPTAVMWHCAASNQRDEENTHTPESECGFGAL